MSTVETQKEYKSRYLAFTPFAAIDRVINNDKTNIVVGLIFGMIYDLITLPITIPISFWRAYKEPSIKKTDGIIKGFFHSLGAGFGFITSIRASAQAEFAEILYNKKLKLSEFNDFEQNILNKVTLEFNDTNKKKIIETIQVMTFPFNHIDGPDSELEQTSVYKTHHSKQRGYEAV